ncbi:DUF2061 domain-containing protein [Candidatus Parcubacteria bacterium]|nr:MAG: DUF2061 domain-containing protein [Candidatus Parcubacteria bacterium]
MHQDKPIRSIIKTISWRFVATLATVALVWVVSGSFSVGLKVGAVEVFLKMFLYYLHERTWDNINWGRLKPFSRQPNGTKQ